MAKEPVTLSKDEAVVEVTDDAVVTVDISDNPDLGAAGAEPDVSVSADPVAPPEPEKKTPVPRVRIKEPAVDPEIEILRKNVEAAENARKAAEATALAERNRAENAQRLAQQRDRDLLAAREAASNSELALINNGIDGTTKQLAALKQQYQNALETGEFAQVAELQIGISTAAATLDRLNTQKAEFEASIKRATAAAAEGAVEDPVPHSVSPFEQYVSQFAPAAQAWLRAHPDCVVPQVGGSAKQNARMMKGHYAALEEGIEPNTPDYFRVIEEHIGARQPVVEAGVEATPRTSAPKQRAPIAAAPISREAPSNQGLPRNTRSVTLTPAQQEAAKISFPTLTPQQAFAQYARNMIELEAEGKLGRTTH